MPELNKDRIFNDSPDKVLRREFELLKNDLTKMGALKYKQLYENAPLSFIMRNSEFIFREPLKGIEFYTELVRVATLPPFILESQLAKFNKYADKVDQMSSIQKAAVIECQGELEKQNSAYHMTAALSNTVTIDNDSLWVYYDALHDYKKGHEPSVAVANMKRILSEESLLLVDAINIISEVPELYFDLFRYIREAYMEKPFTQDDFKKNTYVRCVIRKMMCDPAISAKVNNITNVNLRLLIKELASIEDTDVYKSITTEVGAAPNTYTNPVDAMNKVFNDKEYSEAFSEEYATEKLQRLNHQKAIIMINEGFALADDEADVFTPNPLIEHLCAERADVESVPQTAFDQFMFLESVEAEINSEIEAITERYFTADGSPSKIIASSVGSGASDGSISKKKKDDEDEEDNSYAPTNTYKPDEDESDNDDETDKDTDDTKTPKSESDIKDDPTDEDEFDDLADDDDKDIEPEKKPEEKKDDK